MCVYGDEKIIELLIELLYGIVKHHSKDWNVAHVIMTQLCVLAFGRKSLLNSLYSNMNEISTI